MSKAGKARVLVTGGAGYIGSHACKVLARAGYVPITYDNLSTGWREAVKFGPFEEGDLMDRQRLDEVFRAHNPVAVMHFAALSQVGESTDQPGRYWRENVLGSLNLAEACIEAGCRNIVLSSTCATFGDQDDVLLAEDTPQAPINAYGGSKLAVEGIFRDVAARHGLSAVVFRYFNVAGADPEAEIGEFHQPETHLVPLVLDAICGTRPELTINGTDYQTPDGTCIRDYVHVMDLADAHVQGLEWLLADKGNAVFNLGTGTGFSVREVIDAAGIVTNRKVPVVEGPRRPGDCKKLVSGGTRAREDLGWNAGRSTLREMISDAWRWHQGPGYRK